MKATLDPTIIQNIKGELDRVNPFVKQYRFASAMLSCSPHPPVRLCLLGSRETDGRMYNIPT